MEGSSDTSGEVLKRLKDAGLTANQSKCDWGKSEIEYLGHVVGSGKTSVPSARVADLRNFKRPGTKKQLRSFLGLVGFYRRFIQDFGKLAQPLYSAIKREMCEQVQWKNQMQDGRELPVGFHSRPLRGAEARYSASEVECLAVVDSVRHFEVYLQGTEFKIRTDHKALLAVKKNAILNSRLRRWILFLQQFHFKIEHKPGKMNLPDVLSRQNWTGGGGGIIKKNTLESPRDGD